MRLSLRLLSSVVQRRPFYITTPIFYVNAEPHIGHLYTAVVADAVQRFEKLTNPHFNIIFSTGTDEHGTKIQRAAAAANSPPRQYCDAVSQLYRELFREYHVEYTQFVRTSEERHKKAVTHFWSELVARDAVYKARYSGWYCVADESFVPEAQLADHKQGPAGQTIKVSAESGQPVEWMQEENYMFRLSAYRQHLQKWLSTEGVIVPSKFQVLAAASVRGDTYLPDISVSRPASRVAWAVPVPGDPSQSIYVWVDALVNYLTAIGYPDSDEMKANGRPWPADLQVVGKDILKFHAIYWPALLMSVSLPPPRRLLTHAHWTRDGHKMSKSRGNVLPPRAVAAGTPAGADALRYALLREATGVQDANFSTTKFVNTVNSELADTLGNLLSRSLAMRGPARTLPHYRPLTEVMGDGDDETRVMEAVERLADTCHVHYTNFQFYKAVDAVIKTLHSANFYFEARRPWDLRKSPDKQTELDNVLHVTWETLRVAGIVLQPIIPDLTDKLLTKLGVPSDQRLWVDAKPAWLSGGGGRALQDGDKFVLFQRIEKVKKEGQKEKKEGQQEKKEGQKRKKTAGS